ncbi:MAG: hypothetical protein GXP02_05670 [Alphaproteobacteria bacterium]|nr:hypothetical protein [Alphaproteobacteria bacterium]
MGLKKGCFTPEQYVAAMEYEYAGMINALCYLCQEADNAKLDFVGLHLHIAIEELKEYHKTAGSTPTKQPLNIG